MHEIAIQWLLALTFVVGFTLSDPVIVINPVDTDVLEGEEVTLRCVVQDIPPGRENSVQWIRGNFALGNDRNISFKERYSMVGDIGRGEYNLNIKRANVAEDDNTFECQVTEYELRSNIAKLTVFVEPNGPYIDNAKMVDDVLKVDVVVGKENELTCRAIGGKPGASLQWFKNDLQVAEGVLFFSDGPVNKLYNTSATLRIAPTLNKDTFIYTCVMTSEAFPQEKKSTIQLNLLEPPKVSVFFSEKIYENSNFVAECRSYASPPVLSYRWFFNDDLQEGKQSMDIDLGVVNKTWNGIKIGCEARNVAGYSERSEKRINVIYAPIIVDYTDKVEADIGQNKTLSCSWDSNPTAKVTWTRDGSDAVLGRSSDLVLTNVKQTDSGFYKCIASVDETKDKSSVTSQLIVNGPPLFNHDQQQTAILGEVGVVRCSLSSYPGIQKVVWVWETNKVLMTLQGNGSQFGSENGVEYRGKFEPGSTIAKLEISKVKKEDLHSYKCTVSNSYGEKSVNIFLEEDSSHPSKIFTSSIMIAVYVGVSILVIAGLIIACCCYRKRQQKSTNFGKENKKEPMGQTTVIGGDELIKKNHKDDPNSGAYKVRSSLSSHEGEPVSTVSDNDRLPLQHVLDDGYHTEEAYSWTRNEPQDKTEADSSLSQNPASNKFRADYVDLPPVSEEADHQTPLLKSQPYSKYPPRSMLARTPVSALQSASALDGRFSPSLQYQRQLSDVSSHAPSMYSSAPTDPFFGVPSMTNYPDLIAPYSNAPYYSQPQPAFIPPTMVQYARTPPMPYDASQSSLDRIERESALSASNAARQVEGRNLHSRMSQSSKSSEFTRPMVARMATHV